MNSILKNKKTFAAVLTMIFLIAVAFIVKNAVDRHEYSSYRVVKVYGGSTDTTTESSSVKNSSSSTDTVDTSSKYMNVDGQILRYSGDGAALLDEDLQTVWDESFSMTNPRAEASGSEILIYDQLGSSISIYNEKGKVGSFDTGKPILKARVSKSDTAAVLMQDENKTAFAYYKSDGTVIASGQASMDSPGYPVDLSISPNAENVAISYVTTKSGATGTTVEFYNFGEGGSEKENNLMGSLSFPRSLVPIVDYVSDSQVIAVYDGGFSAIHVGTKPSVSQTISFSKDIISAFHDPDHIGFIFSGTGETPYSLSLYSTKGTYLTNTDISMHFTSAIVSDDQIILWNTSEFAIYSMKGFCRFSGKVEEGTVRQVLRVGTRDYMILTDEKLEIVRLK